MNASSGRKTASRVARLKDISSTSQTSQRAKQPQSRTLSVLASGCHHHHRVAPGCSCRQYHSDTNVRTNHYVSKKKTKGLQRNPLSVDFCRSFGSTVEASVSTEAAEILTDSRDRKVYGEHRQNPWSGVSESKLLQETRRLEQHLERGLQNACQNKGKGEEGVIIRLDDYFDVLEAGMEHAKLEASRQNPQKAMQAAMRAEQLLEQMQLLGTKQQHGDFLAPTTSFFEVVMQAYAVCNGGSAAAERAHSILNFLEKQDRRRLQPTTKTYNIALNAWAKSHTPEAGLHADRILDTMLQDTTQKQCYPNEFTIVSVMDAWNKSGHPNASNRVMELLRQMMEPWQQQTDNITDDSTDNSPDQQSTTSVFPLPIPLDISMFHVAMDTVIKSATGYRKAKQKQQQHHQNSMTARQAAECVEDMLQSILQQSISWNVYPNVRTYSIVLEAWSRAELMEQSGRAAQRAQRILDVMIERYYGGQQQEHHHDNLAAVVKPNAVSFTSVITAWARAKQAQKAHDTFRRLVHLFQAANEGGGQEVEDVVPSIVVGNAVMAAWAKERRPDFILQVLETMQQIAKETGRQECQPDRTSFNILLDAYGKSGQVQDALSLLKWMEGHSDARYTSFHHTFDRPDNLGSPDLISYNSCMSALAKEGQVEQAEGLLAHMKTRKDVVEPDQTTYTSFLIACARSQEPNRFEKARRIWEEVSSKEAPDVVCRTAFIQACAYASIADKQVALNTALEVFAALPNMKRNQVMYLTITKAINRLLVWHDDDDQQISKGDDTNNVWQSKESLQEGRIRLLQEICQQCCDGGYLSQNVHLELSRARWDSQDVVLAWLDCTSFDPNWSRNVSLREKPIPLKERQHRSRSPGPRGRSLSRGS